MYERNWHRKDPDTDIFYKLLESDRTRPTIMFLWDQLFEAEWEIQGIEEHYLQEIEKYKKRAEELEARFLKDSHNSNKPPSSEPFKKKPRSLREKSGKKPGGQPGHSSSVPHHVESPDETRLHPVHRCGRCNAPLKSVKLAQYEVRQVIDIKNGRKFVIEHRAEMKVCPKCQSMNHGGFPPEARAYVSFGSEVRRIALYFQCYQLLPVKRTRELFDHLYGISISTGTLSSWIVAASRNLKNWENEAKKKIINSEVAHFDETGTRIAGDIDWLHVSSTEAVTLLVPHHKRGAEAWDSIGVLPDFKGKAVHDGWSPYFNYTNCSHVLCNAHHLRELIFIEESEEERWATEMKDLFRHALHQIHVKQAKNKPIGTRWIRTIEAKYDRIIKKGYRAYKSHCPRHPPKPRSGPQERRDPGHNLLHRLHFYKKETLAFLNGTVPFTNNQGERDLRMAKVKQKISTSFRSFGGAKGFFRVRSFLSTKLKEGVNPFRALSILFQQYELNPLMQGC